MKTMYFTAAALLLFAGCSPAMKNFTSEFEGLISAEFSDYEPGGIISVQKNGKTVFLKAYGIEDTDTETPISEHSVFNTGSVSKTLTAYGILLLAEQNALSLDDPISLYFDDFDHPKIADKVNIRHLLTHTSGLPDSRKVSEEFEHYLTAKDEENFEPLKHTTELNFEPGERFQYSNPAFNGLALIIEKVTGAKWQHFVEENIFKPAGMNNSTITDGPHPESGVTHGYVLQNGVYTEMDYGEEPTFAAAGNGGVWSSISDFANYERALQNHIFLSDSLIRLSQTVWQPENWSSELAPDTGLSWFIAEADNPANEFGVKIISHTGWQGGFRAFYVSIPEKGILYTALFNRPVNILSESYNPFGRSENNENDIRLNGVRLLQKYNWLE